MWSRYRFKDYIQSLSEEIKVNVQGHTLQQGSNTWTYFKNIYGIEVKSQKIKNEHFIEK